MNICLVLHSQYVRNVYTNYNQVCQELSRKDWSFIENTDAPDSPFLTHDIKLAIQKKKKLWNKYKDMPTQVNYDRLKQLFNKAWQFSWKLTRE
jgi:hypothetical protein